MNKKFSTLMAGLMLVSAFSVAEAQKVVSKYETSKTYYLGVSSSAGSSSSFDLSTSTNEQVIAVISNPSHPDYGQLILVKKAELDNVSAVNAASWSIVFTQPTDGTAPKFTYINKATGLTLSLDKDEANELATIKGSSSSWLNSSTTNTGSTTPIDFANFRSYYGANKYVSLVAGTEQSGANAGKNFFGTQADNTITYTPLTVFDSEESTGPEIFVAPVQPMVLGLNAQALNSQLGKLDLNFVPDDEEYFNLYFNQDVTSGAETNLFAATPLQAVAVKWTAEDEAARLGTEGEESYYVQLKAKDMDGAYITVDTAYHAGSETIGKLPKFTYAKKDYEGTNNVARMPESSHFAFAYDPFEDRLLIKVRGYYTKTSTRPKEITGVDGNYAATWWGFNADDASNKDNANLVVNDAYVRLATLASVRELTVAAKGNTDTNDNYTTPTWTTKNGTSNTNWSDYGMLTNVTMSVADQTFAPTSVADGLYLIKLHTSGYDKNGNKRTDGADGDYLIASLGGNFGYAEQAKRQNYDHMPAAQWLVQKQGTSSTAPIMIINREFFDQKADDNTYFGVNGNAIQAFTAGAANRVMFTAGAFEGDTLEFIPVSEASKKDAYLGYKYVTPEQASVETYYFNYLSGLALDKGLNTPSDKDSLVRVDENGDKIALRLVPVVKDDSYGQQFDEKETGVAKLIRNAYYIEAYDNLKFAADGRSRYLSYEPATKKYVMSLVPELFFLKENNDIDGTHYYALVKANAYSAPVGNARQESYADGTYYTEAWASNELNALKKKMYPAVYAGKDIRFDADIWTFEELKNTDKKTVNVAIDHGNNSSTLLGEVEVKNPLSQAQRDEVEVIFYDEDGEPVIADASKAIDLYAYVADENNTVISLQRVVTEESDKSVYYAMNPDSKLFQNSILVSWNDKSSNKPTDAKDIHVVSSFTTDYATNRLSVDDNTLDLFRAVLDNGNWQDELRVSAFEAEVNDSPLYRRFNGANGEYGTSANAPLNLKFFRHNNDQEFLFENYSSANKYRDGLKDNSISFLGVNNAMQFAESETRSYTMYVDTAYVRNNTRMPQYLIGVRPEVVEGDTIWCNATSAHHHETLADSLACDHTVFTIGFTRAMYLFNAQDSVDAKNYDYQGKVSYGAQGYTRLAFKDAVHAKDSLFILKPGVTTKQIEDANFKDTELFTDTIALDNNAHKNVVFQFRLIDEANNRFLIESEADPEMIAPMTGGWVKIQNGVPVIARMDFNEAIAQAEIFDVTDEIQYDATANDEVAVEAVKVIAGDGQVTIMGAAGKNVTITNILGKVIASQVIASDNATIAVPAGIVAVAVEGEDAVKAIVK